MILRPYQTAAIDAVRARYAAGDRSTLIVLPTGTGKTVVFAEMARRVGRGGGRTLVLAHRTELVDQALEKLAAAGVRAAAEQGTRRVRTAGAVDCVVASVQTLRGDRLRGWQPDSFALGVVDEAHHAPAKAYGDVVAHFRGARWLGVTATPDRLDGAALGHVFESCAYTYEMRDAIRDGYLSPLTALRVDVPSLDLSSLATRAGDLAQDQLAAKMVDDDSLHAIAAPLAELSRGRRTMAFAVNVAHAHALAAVLCWYEPGCARAAHGGMAPADRAAVLRDFRAGKFRILVNCALYTEGFDEPSIACVAVARPTKSRALYAQMVGRGTRVAPGKRDCLVLDFVGQAGRHRLMNPADVLAGGALDDADRGDAEAVLSEAGDGIDVGALLAELAKRREVRPVQYKTREVKMGLSAEELGAVIDLFGDAARPPGDDLLSFFAARNTPAPRGV